LPNVPYANGADQAGADHEAIDAARLYAEVGSKFALGETMGRGGLQSGGSVSLDGGFHALSGQIERAKDDEEAANGYESLNARDEDGPERGPSAFLLGLQIVVGTLLFTLGCFRIQYADDLINRHARGALLYGIGTLLCVFGGLSLYAISATLLVVQ
jgi:hypothetical protein